MDDGSGVSTRFDPERDYYRPFMSWTEWNEIRDIMLYFYNLTSETTKQKNPVAIRTRELLKQWGMISE